MSQAWYEVAALGMRYWFTLLALVIVYRAVRWMRKDSRLRKQVLRELPDAGYIGTLYVLEGESDTLDQGDTIHIPVEGVLGSAMGCDVLVPHASVASRHLLFHLYPDGLHIRPFRDDLILVDGKQLYAGDTAIVRHGAIITLGAVMLQLRLFVGVEFKQIRDANGETLAPPPAKKPAPKRRAAVQQAPAEVETEQEPPQKLAQAKPVRPRRPKPSAAEETEPAPQPAPRKKPIQPPRRDDNPIYGDPVEAPKTKPKGRR